jgi:hypothetical protein
MTTPYDLRFNLINFAKQQLHDEYQAALERIMLSFPDESIHRAAMIGDLKYPTKDDILKLAEELKAFIDKK